MGRKKRSSPTNDGGHNSKVPKKAKYDEKYPVKKYRPDRNFSAMDAFVKYTKSHRMTDAAYVRWDAGETPEKPFVFACRVGGINLGWGRGKTRDSAIDAACRAAFSLVSAHGYNHFPIDDDCLTTEPIDVVLPPPPPPPPPPPVGMPPLPPGMPPGFAPPLPQGVPPSGLPPGYPPAVVPPASDLIPQPKVADASLPVASSLSGSMAASSSAAGPQDRTVPVSLSLTASTTAPPPAPESSSRRKLKGGLTLAFDPDSDGPDETCMEERRASLDRYQKLLAKAIRT